MDKISLNFLRKTIDSKPIARYHNFNFELNYVYILDIIFFTNFKSRKIKIHYSLKVNLLFDFVLR